MAGTRRDCSSAFRAYRDVLRGLCFLVIELSVCVCPLTYTHCWAYRFIHMLTVDSFVHPSVPRHLFVNRFPFVRLSESRSFTLRMKKCVYTLTLKHTHIQTVYMYDSRFFISSVTLVNKMNRIDL